MKIVVKCQQVKLYVMPPTFAAGLSKDRDDRAEVVLRTEPINIEGVWAELKIYGPPSMSDMFPFRKDFTVTIEPEIK